MNLTLLLIWISLAYLFGVKRVLGVASRLAERRRTIVIWRTLLLSMIATMIVFTLRQYHHLEIDHVLILNL